MDIDYLIVGQGIAGSVLSFLLAEQGKSLMVIDEILPNTSSRVAAGIINPVTGARFVKSWKIEELATHYSRFYARFEALTGKKVFKEMPIIKALQTIKQENDWFSRAAQDGWRVYMPDETPDIPPSVFRKYHCLVTIAKGGRVDTALLIETWRDYLMAKNAFRKEKFDYDALQMQTDGIVYKDLRPKKIIFCEGARAADSPLWGALPFQLSKGEHLTVAIKNYAFDDFLLKDAVYIVPNADKTYWVGATNDFNDNSPSPTAAMQLLLESDLQESFAIDYDVVGHRAAIRPSTKSRRPFIGAHADYPSLYLMNGLGTKGASLAPFVAQSLLDFIEKGIAIDPEMQIA